SITCRWRNGVELVQSSAIYWKRDGMKCGMRYSSRVGSEDQAIEAVKPARPKNDPIGLRPALPAAQHILQHLFCRLEVRIDFQSCLQFALRLRQPPESGEHQSHFGAQLGIRRAVFERRAVPQQRLLPVTRFREFVSPQIKR